MSLPSRERGLKFFFRYFIITHFFSVAPFAGAWIEISSLIGLSNAPLSLPSRERGLKLPLFPMFFIYRKSLPSRERGLKLKKFVTPEPFPVSLPSRERGLKLAMLNRIF